MDPEEASSAAPGSETSNLKKKKIFLKPKSDRKNYQVDSSPLLSPFIGPSNFGQSQQSDAGAATDSDPDDNQSLAQETGNAPRGPTVEEDREALLKDLDHLSWEDYGAFRAAHAERVQRCFMADERDQNRTILHWLALKLLPKSITQQHLNWLVEMVVAYDPDIITRITGDSQKANCLHLAVQQRRFDLVLSLCLKGNPEVLREAISQGNHSEETCLHLAIKLNPPNLKVVMQLLDKADPKVIAKQRSCKILGDEAEDLNTVLHDFVHIDQCFEKGYMKILKLLIQECPEAMKVQNSAKETPFQFHLATRDKRYPEWEGKGLEFSTEQNKVTGRNLQNGSQGGTIDKQTDTVTRAGLVGQLLLNESFSQSTYEDAYICLYGEKHFEQAISFQPASPININTDRSHPFLKFYPILSYVELTLVEPESAGEANRDTTMQLAGSAGLSSTYNDSAHSEWKGRTDSIRKVFSWFRKQKVQRILKLVVVDDGTLPCSDAIIEECLRYFDVRYLNWNKDDFCVEMLHKARLSNVRELWLSWSGRNSVLYSWSCKDTGLPTLGKLETVHIDTKPGAESGETDRQNLENFNLRLQDSVSRLQIDHYRNGMMAKVTDTLKEDFLALGPKLKQAILTWTGPPDYAELAKIKADEEPPMIEGTIAKLDARMMYHLKETKALRVIKVDDVAHDNTNEGKTFRHGRPKQQYSQPITAQELEQLLTVRCSFSSGHRWIDAARKLVTAVNKDRLQNELTMRPIKVAVIDDGVTPGELSKPDALKEGWPLPSTRKRGVSKPYYNSEKGHGTKMARLIQMMCPFVSIYVAKVDIYKENDSSVATSAADAIEWAIEKHVDVILMSWTIKKIKSGQGENQKAITSLELAIQKAANNDILMVCAVQDSAHYGNDDIFPQRSDTKKLMVVGSADENGDRSKLVNENSFDYLFPGEVSIPGMLAETDIGSSVAAAIAAGMAAMVLWCAEYHSIATKSQNDLKTEETQSQAPHIGATTKSVITTILGVPKTAPRTATAWDFRRDKRMNALFDALKPAKDRFVDITNVVNQAVKDIDDIDDVTTESQKTRTEVFITTCKENLPLNLR